MIEIHNVTLIRAGKRLLEDLTCTIREGENYVITGNNGSGKTLLMEAIAGGVHLAKGEINYSFIRGESWDTRHREKQKTIRYTPAHALQSISAGQSSFYYQQRYYADEENDVDDVQTLLGATAEELHGLGLPDSLSIAQLLKIKITRLSNGQLRKILLVKALLGNIPKVLLLDYPFEGLDPESRADLCAFLDGLALRYGIQIIMTGQHYLLPKAITRKLVMDNFKIIADEAVYDVVDDLINEASDIVHLQQTGETIIHIENLGVRYGARQILKDFNWTVMRGDRWALIGRNGSGKTTLFSMIFADHPMAYTQKIFLFGRRRGTGESVWDIKKRIGYVGPEILTFLNPKSIHLTAREYVAAQTHCAGDALSKIITYFEAFTFFDLPVQALSSGQLQLMEIICCFVSKKELLLLDEPFQFLDEKVQERLRSYLREQLDEDTTLILITHEARDITAWATKIIRL